MVALKHDLCRHLEDAGALHVLAGEPVARHTTFRIGGPARFLLEVGDELALSRVLRLVEQEAVPYLVLGGGSNVLAPDEGIEAVVLKLRGEFAAARFRPGRVTAGAGSRLRELAICAAEAGLAGLEFAATIPGTLGGALAGNAGYGGSRVGDLLEDVRLLVPGGGFAVLSRGEIEFGYRLSSLKGRGIILGGTLRLALGDRARIASEMERLAAMRRATQPLGMASAGCVFKNPPGGSAGRLIAEAGLAGARAGNAEISSVHANFIVNRGGARAEDVKRLIAIAIERVRDRSGVSLELEIEILQAAKIAGAASGARGGEGG